MNTSLQEMKRVGVYQIEDVLPYLVSPQVVNELRKRGIKRSNPEWKKATERKYKGHMVKMTSLRYQLFAAKGLKCVECGIEGTFFSLERPLNAKNDNPQRYHFNLYGLEEDGKTWRLITKDHIISRKKGGTDTLGNLQVMCSECNQCKDSKHDERLVDKALDVLSTFIGDINATGGVLVDERKRVCGLVADPNWYDLAITVQQAVEILNELGRLVKVKVAQR